ncbi:hypothetical protein [Paraburkholderia caffeinilytica]|uniref:Uncharacterized protein n=1 Tax=Paraburkholderia caffeinilytica TaxID=1761016 RepID=A0ABQ1N7V3_9BURK|nr:hypothetical protein [Paraburkholderia caffeinilytica]GGC57757.1 hypothetical protein GCM10011400_51780 [Paraburkholderia caffeinilytica]CAB3804869.1 hypothetical protein LMG28690_06119 [Paraburkholderia caffeinilytica]
MPTEIGTDDRTDVQGQKPVTYLDRTFRSRTLVFADGSTLAVEKSTAVASNDEQIAALDRHPDFERMTDGS